MFKYAETRNFTFATTASTRNQENFTTYRKNGAQSGPESESYWCKEKYTHQTLLSKVLTMLQTHNLHTALNLKKNTT